MIRTRRASGWTIYDALLAIALCGMLLISLNFAAASAAAASQAAQNRLFALNLIKAEIAKHQTQPAALAASGPAEIDVKSRSSHFTGEASSLQVPGKPNLYQVTVSLKWQEHSKSHSSTKTVLVFAQGP